MMKTTSLLVTVLAVPLFAAYDVEAQDRVDAPMLLEQASHAQMVEGDLDRAVSLYTQVAMSATASRNNVAQALVALGNTYELQGSPDAIPAYERVVSEFADQPESFLAANAKLTALSKSSSAATVAGGGKAGGDYMLVLEKLIPSRTLQPRMHDFSPDGKTLVYVSYASSERKKQFPALRSEIYIRDTVGAVGRPLIEDAGDWEYIVSPRWSPDGRYVFYKFSKGGGTSKAERRFMLLDVHSRESRQLAGDFLKLADRSRDTEWMPDSNGLVIQLVDKSHWLMGLDGVEKKHFPRLKGSRCGPTRMGTVSPDGRHLLLHACTAGTEGFTEVDIWQLDLENGEYSELTNDAGYEGWPVWNRDGTQIYYVSGPEAARNVYRRKPGSDEPPVKITTYSNSSAIYPRILPRDGQLTFVLMKDNHVIFTADTGAMDTSAAAVVRGSGPMPSPDGKFIYYINDQPGHVGLWKISVKGENPEQLVSGHVLTTYGRKSRLSPDGSTIAYAQQTGDTTSLFVMPSAGGKATSVYSANGVRNLIPAWSPNSREIAFSIGGDMMVLPANGGDVTVLASVKKWESWSLEWSPDGKSIAGFAFLEGEESNHVMVVDRTTKKLTRATPQSEDQYKEGLAWHPDGNRISYMYYNTEDGNGSRIVNLKNSEVTDLVDMPDPYWDYIGIWGPDNRYYFGSVGRRMGIWGVYAFDESSGEYQQIRQFHDRSVSLPSWSADGNLMTWSEKEPVRQIWMMTDYE